MNEWKCVGKCVYIFIVSLFVPLGVLFLCFISFGNFSSLQVKESAFHITAGSVLHRISASVWMEKNTFFIASFIVSLFWAKLIEFSGDQIYNHQHFYCTCHSWKIWAGMMLRSIQEILSHFSSRLVYWVQLNRLFKFYSSLDDFSSSLFMLFTKL